jgi:hypothetical protein
LNIIKVGNHYVNLDQIAYAVGDTEEIQVFADWAPAAICLVFKGDEARQVREALDILAAMNRWERAT